jgi:hypothetical protein
MALLAEAHGLAQFVAGLRPFLRHPTTVDEAGTYVRQKMRDREETFVRIVEATVFANSRSPYLKLLRAAGCEPGDVRRLVRQDGIEGALRHLLQAGVYVTYDEFKGRTPAVRGSDTFSFRDSDFDNPLTATHFPGSTGGSTGRPSRIRMNLHHLEQSAPHWALWFAAHDWLDSDVVFRTPEFAGVANRQLIAAKIGKRMVRWFSQGAGQSRRDRLTASVVHALIRRAAGFPKPEFVPLDQAWKVGESLISMVDAGARPCVVTSPSSAVRVCRAMQQRGLSLESVTFILGAEPLTPSRRASIEEAGATAVPTYGFAEGGTLGLQCPEPTAADDVHIMLDAFAVITRPRAVFDGEPVDALLLTALRPACPKIMLNAEIGDFAVLEARSCGCLFDEFGYRQHLHTIRSFDKLTGEGVTFVGVDLFKLLEDVLPRRFGGTVGDYQLIERQDAQGLLRYTLLVSPNVGRLDERAVTTAFLEELARMKGSYRLMTALWDEAGALRLKRLHPISTARGKVLPFRRVHL